MGVGADGTEVGADGVGVGADGTEVGAEGIRGLERTVWASERRVYGDRSGVVQISARGAEKQGPGGSEAGLCFVPFAAICHGSGTSSLRPRLRAEKHCPVWPGTPPTPP
eukprot:5949441-Pyramimonas_sp.AAC.1